MTISQERIGIYPSLIKFGGIPMLGCHRHQCKTSRNENPRQRYYKLGLAMEVRIQIGHQVQMSRRAVVTDEIGPKKRLLAPYTLAETLPMPKKQKSLTRTGWTPAPSVKFRFLCLLCYADKFHHTFLDTTHYGTGTIFNNPCLYTRAQLGTLDRLIGPRICLGGGATLQRLWFQIGRMYINTAVGESQIIYTRSQFTTILL
ncbi:hypothetical protein BGX38DRAFT_43648 [Terfezia claveryi]|nr:hypothetical protein BGX38DRAFT_43648 [Terfezia claveryi]